MLTCDVVRAIVNTLTVEELNKWRKKCAESVQVGSLDKTNIWRYCSLYYQEVAGRDLYKLGVEVISFTLKDITDEEEYLLSLGRLREAFKNFN